MERTPWLRSSSKAKASSSFNRPGRMSSGSMDSDMRTASQSVAGSAGIVHSVWAIRTVTGHGLSDQTGSRFRCGTVTRSLPDGTGSTTTNLWLLFLTEDGDELQKILQFHPASGDFIEHEGPVIILDHC